MQRAYIVKNIDEFEYLNSQFLDQYYPQDSMERIMDNFSDGIIVYGWSRPEYDDIRLFKDLNNMNNIDKSVYYTLGMNFVKVSDLMIKKIRKEKLQQINKCE